MPFTKEACSAGGRAQPASAKSFSKDRALAAEAGRKGGSSVPAHKRTFSTDRELALRAGRAGGQASAKATAARRAYEHTGRVDGSDVS